MSDAMNSDAFQPAPSPAIDPVVCPLPDDRAALNLIAGLSNARIFREL